ncbi:voltage-gated sodium channel [Streptosporangium album]|uniref:Voltage-gated sodium channel n=1 Tax=Streptosporangium album TaxID=47479 RepID=A0A7W7WCW5_9ACTN|nr:ion transporter [Streptosporangium album]MBB4942481.1 voltage-gated sodium channel [Streptosporangium album]
MPGRERIRSFLETRLFQRAVVAVIVVNAITIGCETSSYLTDRIGGLLHVVDRIALTVFAVELVARLYAYRGAFFKDPWNWFDTTVVAIALIPASGPASVLRTLRIMRALRLVATVPSMRKVVGALFAALPGMGAIIGLLVLVMYVSGVMATQLFGEIVPEYFAELPTSLFTLFQIMTGEAWPDIAQEVMAEKPWAWVFFVGYILMASYVVLNLFIAVVVNAMDDQNTSAEEQRTEDQLTTVLNELARLHARIDAMQSVPQTAQPVETPHGNTTRRSR